MTASRIDLKSLSPGDRVAFEDRSPSRASRSLGPRATGRVVRVHYGRDCASILADDGEYHEVVHVDRLRPVETPSRAVRYARDPERSGAPTEVGFSEGDEVLYRGCRARVLRRYRGGHGWVYDVVALLGSGRDLILTGIDADQIQPTAGAEGRPAAGMDHVEARELTRYCRDNNICESIAAAGALAEFRRTRVRG